MEKQAQAQYPGTRARDGEEINQQRRVYILSQEMIVRDSCSTTAHIPAPPEIESWSGQARHRQTSYESTTLYHPMFDCMVIFSPL